MNLIELLENSALREASNALSAARTSGPAAKPDSGTEARTLLETYRRRLEHLRQFDSHHAQRLLKATDEFCQALGRLPPQTVIALVQVDDPLLGSYALWIDTEAQALIGCQYLIGKSEVAAADWNALWERAEGSSR